MRARTRLIRLQRLLYDRLKDYARDLLGGFSPELNKYFLEYKRDFRTFQEVSTKRELLAALQNAHIVVCGDYHTLSQAQRTVIRLLRGSLRLLKRRKSRLILALEMARPQDNPKIARFLAGRVSEDAFLHSISFSRNWGFPWKNYRRLFQFAKDHEIEIVGINLAQKGNRRPTLKERDRFAAKVVAELSAQDEKALVVVLMGDLHLASNHLPKDLRTVLASKKIKRTVLVVHQNHELFYWELVERGLEQMVDVVKVRDQEYCVMNTPPWVKLKSHLKWTEIMADVDSNAPLLQKKEAEVGALDGIDYTDEIRELITLIQAFIGLPPTLEDDFLIYSPADLSFLNRLRKDKGWSKLEIRRLARALAEYDSLFVPGENIIFLSSLSLNHAATQAAIYLHAKVSGRDVPFREPRRDFYAKVLIEALGFIGSRIVNHKRKCNGPEDLKRLVDEAKEKRPRKKLLGDLRVAQLALSHFDAEQALFNGNSTRLSGFPLPDRAASDEVILRYRKVATLLGQLLGHAIYTAAMENRVTREEILDLFRNPFRDRLKTKVLYLTWARRMDEFGYRHVTKNENL